MKYTLYIALLCTLVACSTTKDISKTDMSTYKWLIGDWQKTSSEGIFRESWDQINDSTYEGLGTFQVGAEIVFSEDILFQKRKGKLEYVVTAGTQNGGDQVTFTCTKAKKNYLVFENPEHDYPSKITYLSMGRDSMVAQIFGEKNGRAATEIFPFDRVK
jgi:hypothetical protein